MPPPASDCRGFGCPHDISLYDKESVSSERPMRILFFRKLGSFLNSSAYLCLFVLGEVRFSLNDGSDRYVPDGSLIVRSSVLYEVVLDSEKEHPHEPPFLKIICFIHHPDSCQKQPSVFFVCLSTNRRKKTQVFHKTPLPFPPCRYNLPCRNPVVPF